MCGWLGQAGGASAAAWTHVPHHVSWCGPSLHVSHFPNQIQSSNCCPALLPALVERHTWRVCLGVAAESIEWFIDDQAFFPTYVLAPSPPPSRRPPASCLSLSVFLGVAGQAYWGRREDGGGGSQIVRRRESLVLYKSFNTLCTNQSAKSHSQLG